MVKREPGRPGHKNRLAAEKSPYLLQHAQNPVDWYPWGGEAFEAARDLDRPIFLSIGYSTCHWCHVMAHESFEDPGVAALMNESFVNIKVDREERPDIDSVYMSVCQMVTGGGGWPLTIVMTPDRRPFFAGTYFPREGRFGRAGMLDLVPALAKAWKERRGEVLESAAEVTKALSSQSGGGQGEAMDERFINTAALQLNERFDEERGGFGTAPKFPSPHNLSFLLRFWRRADDEWSLEMVVRTLHAMRQGGIHDHVGHGFHRYSTDREWLVPHFEKMLYDQAGLLIAYTEAFQATGEEAFAWTAEETAQYVLRDLRSPEGAFFSAEDADSEGEEGRFYVWTLPMLREVLGEDDAAIAARVWNVRAEGNFRDEATGRPTGANILHLSAPVEDLAGSVGLGVEELEGRIEDIRGRLFEARGRRVRPHLDDKVLTDWNGYMVAALAKAGTTLERPELVDAARQAADFVLDRLLDGEGRLVHSWREGTATAPGHLDDYAFLVWGLLELYEATFEDRYLASAVDLTETMVQRFWDGEAGGFFLTPDDGEMLLVRPKEAYDGAIPSGNSVAMHDLLRVGLVTADPRYDELAEGVSRAFSTDVGRMPSGFAHMMGALDRAMGGSRVVVIVGEPGAEDTEVLVSALRTRYLPDKAVLLRRPDGCSEGLAGCAPYLPQYEAKDGRATAYVCQRDMCRPATHDVGKMLEHLS